MLENREHVLAAEGYASIINISLIPLMRVKIHFCLQVNFLIRKCFVCS